MQAETEPSLSDDFYPMHFETLTDPNLDSVDKIIYTLILHYGVTPPCNWLAITLGISKADVGRSLDKLKSLSYIK